jgi:hypothetical protein
MALYRTILSGHPRFFEHIRGGDRWEDIVKDPAALQFPGDIEAIGPREVHMLGEVQRGKLLINVTITFPDGEVMIFPPGSEIDIIHSDEENQTAHLKFDIQGQPIQAPPHIGGRRRHRSTRRKGSRRHRKLTRRNRN